MERPNIQLTNNVLTKPTRPYSTQRYFSIVSQKRSASRPQRKQGLGWVVTWMTNAYAVSGEEISSLAAQHGGILQKTNDTFRSYNIS